MTERVESIVAAISVGWFPSDYEAYEQVCEEVRKAALATTQSTDAEIARLEREIEARCQFGNEQAERADAAEADVARKDELLDRLTWKPIETCPTDGTGFFVWSKPYNLRIAYGRMQDGSFGVATHWMRPPKPGELDAALAVAPDTGGERNQEKLS